jgi:Ca2+-binding EF-hand superfamily protein
VKPALSLIFLAGAYEFQWPVTIPMAAAATELHLLAVSVTKMCKKCGGPLEARRRAVNLSLVFFWFADGAPYGGAPAYGYSAPPAFPVSYGAVTNPRAAQLFMAVDTDRSGSVTAKELQVALSSGGYVFNSRAVKKMIAIFDVDSSGTLSYAEFEKLLETLQQWTTLFNSADRDRSGKLSNSEVKNCLRGLGFNLPEVTLDKMMSSVDDDGEMAEATLQRVYSGFPAFLHARLHGFFFCSFRLPRL